MTQFETVVAVAYTCHCKDHYLRNAYLQLQTQVCGDNVTPAAAKIRSGRQRRTDKLFSVKTAASSCSVGAKPRTTAHHWSPGDYRHRKRKCSTIFLERTRKDHRKSDQQWNSRKTSERRGGAQIGFRVRLDTILN